MEFHTSHIFVRQNNSDDPPPVPDEKKLRDNLWLEFDIVIMILINLIMICSCTLLLYRVCKGTRYPFIMVLTILLLASNICGAVNAFFLHKLAVSVSMPPD